MGQALLERHEAYVRRHEVRNFTPDVSGVQGTLSDGLYVRQSNSPSEKSNKSAVPISERGAPRRIVSSSQVDARVAELVREVSKMLYSTILHSSDVVTASRMPFLRRYCSTYKCRGLAFLTRPQRLSQALVNSEVTDVTHQKLLSELSEAKATVTRLKTQNARAIGLDSRLTIMMQEKDDIQQERDSATQRARMAEARVSSLKETCGKLQIHGHAMYAQTHDT